MATDINSSYSNVSNRTEVNKVKALILYNYSNTGPFEVYMESKDNNQNLGNLHNVSLAKFVFDLNLSDLQKFVRKGKNIISVQFKTYQAANNFVVNYMRNLLFLFHSIKPPVKVL